MPDICWQVPNGLNKKHSFLKKIINFFYFFHINILFYIYQYLTDVNFLLFLLKRLKIFPDQPLLCMEAVNTT